MRRLPTLLLGAPALLAACQGTRPLYPVGLYRTAADFRVHHPTPVGTRAGRVLPARAAYVETSFDARRRVALDSLWGYAGVDGAAYRVYRHQAYQLEQVDTLTIYSVLTSADKRSFRSYYFSSGLNGPVQHLTRRQLQQTFAGNPAFLVLLRQLPWYQPARGVASSQVGAGGFWVVALYRQALGLPAPYRR